MKKIGQPSNNPSRWGQALLATGLLLVAVAGILQLQEVQAFFSPGRSHTIELNLIRHECAMIDKGLIALRADLTKLQGFCSNAARLEPGGPSLLLKSAPPVRITAEPAWPTTLHRAKKDRVYVARKLRYIEIMLKSMEQAIERRHSFGTAVLLDKKPEKGKTLRQIQEIRTRCQIYDRELRELSEKLTQLAGYSVSQ